jgi:hypothetical protein
MPNLPRGSPAYHAALETKRVSSYSSADTESATVNGLDGGWGQEDRENNDGGGRPTGRVSDKAEAAADRLHRYAAAAR